MTLLIDYRICPRFRKKIVNLYFGECMQLFRIITVLRSWVKTIINKYKLVQDLTAES